MVKSSSRERDLNGKGYNYQTSKDRFRQNISNQSHFLKGAIMEAKKENWNSAAVLSIHAVISACDAICTKFLQLRHGGMDHMQAVELLGSLPFERSEIESKLKQARRIISLKNALNMKTG